MKSIIVSCCNINKPTYLLTYFYVLLLVNFLLYFFSDFCQTNYLHIHQGGSVAEWFACWTQAQKGLGSNHSRDAVG